MAASSSSDMDGQLVIVAGASRGLGKSLAQRMVSQGANVAILARGLDALKQTKEELLQLRKNKQQSVDAHALDLSDASKVEAYIASLTVLPSSLYCVAGGTAQEMGFFADISTHHIKSCFDKNYFAAAYITHALLRRWLAEPPVAKETRHIVYTASTAAFCCLPGYGAYTPTKTATRALADTLRQELLLYRHQQDIRVHCSFPGTIFTEMFFEEQKIKPALCKELEDSDNEAKGLSPTAVADKILAGVKQGNFFITMDMDTAILLNNMRGPSPRDSPVWDWLLGFVASLVWPFYSMYWDKRTLAYGKAMLKPQRQRAGQSS